MLGWLRNKWQRDLVTLRERREKAAQKHRDRKILCPRCGYDIKGMPDRPCSECGLFIKSAWRAGRLGAGAPLRVRIWVASTAWYALSAFQIAAYGGPLAWLTYSLTGSLSGPLAPIPIWWHALGAGLMATSIVLLLIGIRYRYAVRFGPASIVWAWIAGWIIVAVVLFTWAVLLKSLVPSQPV